MPSRSNMSRMTASVEASEVASVIATVDSVEDGARSRAVDDASDVPRLRLQRPVGDLHLPLADSIHHLARSLESRARAVRFTVGVDVLGVPLEGERDGELD